MSAVLKGYCFVGTLYVLFHAFALKFEFNTWSNTAQIG